MTSYLDLLLLLLLVLAALGAPFSELEIACVMRDCLFGIAYLHESKKIHRDIKGGNLLFTDQGTIKLGEAPFRLLL